MIGQSARPIFSTTASTRTVLVVAITAMISLGCAHSDPVRHPAAAHPAAAPAAHGPSSWLEAHRDNPTMLRAFLGRLPKGGDLHLHLNGSIYAESFIQWAAEQGQCVNRMTGAFSDPPCSAHGDQVHASAAFADPELYASIVDMASTRYLEASGEPGRHKFFGAFAKLRPVGQTGEKVAEIVARAAAENVQYVEIMITLRNRGARQVGKQVGFDGDLESTRTALLEAGLADELEAAYEELDAIQSSTMTALGCGGHEPDPGCQVEWRFLQQTIRTAPPEQVYSQLVLAFELAATDPRVVGINMVAPEDDPIALRDYSRHMAMIGALSRLRPEVNVALHAGELWVGLVPPRHLRSHIREAIIEAGARRIGHGVSIGFEDDALGLLELMSERQVLVEICPTSNQVILGVDGPEHPLGTYLDAGVPVALATDDAGVLRTDLTNEYLKAVTTHRLSYQQLEQIARDSLSYSFLEGQGLWTSPRRVEVVDACADDRLGTDPATPACQVLLDASAKARTQWRLEAELSEIAAAPWPLP